MTDALGTPEELNGIGLGYLGHSNLGKPLACSLSNHFISVGLQIQDGLDTVEAPDIPANSKTAAPTSFPHSEEVPDTIILDISTDPETKAPTSSPFSREVPGIILPSSPKISLHPDISATDFSGISLKDAEIEDTDPLCELTSLFSDLWPCPSEQEGAGATD